MGIQSNVPIGNKTKVTIDHDNKGKVHKTLSGHTAFLQDNNPQSELQYVVLRTPDEYFAGLKEWNYKPNYISDLEGFEGMRLHYVDIGKPNAQRTILCLHGQKTWSYAFRKAIQYFINDNYRVIAFDLFGFGRSDKPTSDDFYSFDFHRRTALALMAHLELQDVKIAGFEWGGWLAMTLPMDASCTVSGLLLANTKLHTPDENVWSGFRVWRALHNAQSDPQIGAGLSHQDPNITTETQIAYDAPFPNFRYKAGVRKFPNLIPLTAGHEAAGISLRAADYLENEWQGKCALVANCDGVYGVDSMRHLRTRINGAAPVIKIAGTSALTFEYADQFMPQALEIIF